VSLHVDPARFAEATGSARLEMVRHVAGCPACREAVAEHDPALLFALLAITPIPARMLDEVSSGVAAGAGRERERMPLRLAAAAAVAALALITGYATLVHREAPPEPALAAQATPPPAVPAARADVEVEPAGGVSHVVDLTVGETQVVMVYNGDLHL